MSPQTAALALLLPVAILLRATALGRDRVRFRAVLFIAGSLAAAGAILLQATFGGLPPLLLTYPAVLAGAAALGWLIGGTMPSGGGLFVVVGMASLIDTVSFYRGPTATLLSGGGGTAALPYLGLWLPAEGGIRLLIGVTDLAFLTALYHHAPPLRGITGFLSNAAPVLALAAAIVVSVAAGGVPGLPFLAVAAGAMLFLDRELASRALPGRSSDAAV
jgi:hypothetical protein